MSELDAILNNFETTLQDDGASNPIQAEILNLSSSDPKKQEKALREIINASLDDNTRSFIANRDGVAPVIAILNSPSSPILRTLAAHALANLALDQSARFKIVQSNGVQALSSALSTPNASSNLKERSFAALANLTVSEEDIRLDVIRTASLSTFIRIIQDSSRSDIDTSRTGLMLIANLGVSIQGCQDLIQAGSTDVCCSLSNHSDTGVRRHALWACAALSANPSSHSTMENRVSSLLWPLQSDFSELADVIKALTILVNLSGSERVQGNIEGVVGKILGYISGGELNCKVLGLQITQNLGLSERGRVAVGRAGGGRVVLDGLRSLENEGDLAVHGLRAVTNLSQDDRIRAEMAQAGGVDLVRRFSNAPDSDVRESAEQAYSNLTA